jgi:hypothetical protein
MTPPKAKKAKVAGSHLCMWDDQEVYFKHLLNFLHAV